MEKNILIMKSYFLKIGNFHSIGYLVLEKVPMLCTAENLERLEDVTSMKIELKLSSKVWKKRMVYCHLNVLYFTMWTSLLHP